MGSGKKIAIGGGEEYVKETPLKDWVHETRKESKRKRVYH